jgi:hypothetical protein
VRYVNRYLKQDYGDTVSVAYVDVDSPEMSEYPALALAVDQGRSVPLVLVGDVVKSPPVLSFPGPSFAWIVNELKGPGT